MATQIQIKRGAATAETAPSQLAAGELAVTYGDAAAQDNSGDRLYIGNSDASANLIIGGKYFADLTDHVHGTLTASSALIADASSKLDNIKIDNLDLNGNTLSTTDTNGELVLTPHGTAGVGILAGGSSTSGTIKFYEASTNGSNSIAVKSPAAVTANATITLPEATDTLVGKATTDTLTNKTLTSPKVNEDVAITTTSTELNVMDGSATVQATVTLVGTDGVVISDSDTMKQALVSDFDTYISASSATLTNKTLTTPIITEIDSGSTITLDATTDIILDADGGDIFFKDGGVTFGSATNSSGELIIKSGTTTAATFSGANITLAGTVCSGAITSTGGISGTTGTFSAAVDAEIGAAGANVQVGVTGANEIDTSTGDLTIDSQGGTVTIDDNLTISASMTIDMGANRVTNIADPSSAQDAASKAYVDAVKTGLDVKDSCSLGTTANLGYTYDNGAGTLTAGSTGAVSIDSVATTLNMRILVKNQTTNTQNGIYYVSTLGDGSNAIVLTRATDANSGSELSGGSFTFVEKGTTNSENGYVFTHDGDATLGTTALTVSQFSGAGQITAGTSLTKSGNTMNVATDDTTVFTLSDALSVRSTATTGQVLRSTGSAAQAAAYGQLDLANSDAVTGITAVANGGTGANTLTANRMLMANGTSAVSVLGAGTAGMVMISNGASAPAFANVDGGTF